MNRPPPIRLRQLVSGALLPAVLGLCALAPPARLGAEEVSKLAGKWTWSWKDPAGQTHRHTMEVEGVPAKLAARELYDDEPAVKVEGLKLEGKAVRFKVTRGKRVTEYRGELEGDTIDGTVTVTLEDQTNEFPWKATRDTAKTPTTEP